MFIVPDAVIRDVNTSTLGFPLGRAVFAFVLAGLLTLYLGRRGRIVAAFWRRPIALAPSMSARTTRLTWRLALSHGQGSTSSWGGPKTSD